MARAASAIKNFVVHLLVVLLRFTQLCIDFESNRAGDPKILEHFFLLDKSVTSFKLFIVAYREVHTEGVGMFAISCLIGLFLHLFAIVIHLYINHRSRATSWISGMAILLATGAFLLATKIPEDIDSAVEAILICFACLEAFLLVRNKMSENGGNANLLRGLVMILSETVITGYLFVDYLGKTHSPWDAHKILHLVGSCLAVLIGLCRFGWVAYNAYTHQVLAGGEEQAAGAAMDGGDIEQQMVQVVAEVNIVKIAGVLEMAWLTSLRAALLVLTTTQNLMVPTLEKKLIAEEITETD